MDLTTEWTGKTASALQAALRMSNESFAEHLGIGVRTVATWHQKPDLRPRPEMQQLLDTVLAQAPDAARRRFTGFVDGQPDAETERSAATTAAELRLAADPNIATALEWLDQRAHHEPGTSRRDVASRMARLDVRTLHDRSQRRARIDQRSIADALHKYYRDRGAGRGWYTARYGSEDATTTSILTRENWLDLACPLIPDHDRLTITRTDAGTAVSLDEHGVDRAIQRLAETLVTDTRLVNMPLFRLVDIDIGPGSLAGALGITSFIEYALTMDLLEGELIDALADGMPLDSAALPLRDRYLPDTDALLDLPSRLCAGGALAVCAIARPADAHRGEADYVLLIQERSGSVVNATRRLAVLPKGFHQPLTDVRADAQIGATLRREMEEELFGRDDVDNTLTDQRRADPMHPSRLTEPMRWLMADPTRWRMECTGFGLNAVSGNYEFASLIVVEDEEFWTRYGGDIEANWEAATLRQVSSLDGDYLGDLVRDVAWSNEGLFALLQGLRRLRETGGERVRLPAIEWTVR